MISANMKSKQEALNLLDKLQAIGEGRKPAWKQSKEIFGGGERNRQETTGRTIGVST